MPAFTPAQLAAEINGDPAAIGYATKVAAKDDAGVAALLNTPTATDVFRNDIGMNEVVNAIPAADFITLTQLQVSKLSLMFQSTPTIDGTSSNIRTILGSAVAATGLFATLPNTIAALTALAKRKGTRAEVLWGIGTVIGQADVSFALRGAR